MKRTVRAAGAFLLGAAAALLLLEIALRIIGAAYQRTPGGQREGERRPDDAFTVLCLGDSNVYGLGGRSRNFPVQLGEILEAKVPGRRFDMVNLGQPGQNTAMLLETLQNDLDRTRPDVVVALTGGANSFNYHGYRSFRTGRTLRARVSDLSYHIRTLQLARYLARAARRRVSVFNAPVPQARAPGAEATGAIEKAWALRNDGRYEQAAAFLKEEIGKNPRTVPFYWQLGVIFNEMGRYDDAVEWGLKGHALDPSDLDTCACLVRSYHLKGDCETSIAFALRGIEAHPEAPGNPCCIELAHLLREGRVKDKKRLADFFAALEKKRGKVRNSLFRDTQALLDERQAEVSRSVEEWVEHDVRRLIERCRRRGIPVVLLNYPGQNAANRVLEKVARDEKAPLVDTAAVFEALLRRGGRRGDYFVPDGHCNARGYGVVARAVYDVLLRSRLIPGEQGRQ